MQVCSRCLYTSNHPLNLTFDEDGVCSGCRVHEEKDLIDWVDRGKKLKKILNEYRCRSGGNYDCIIPVSGARDSHFIVHTIKNVYGMNPLLVSYNKHYNTHIGVRNFANLRMHFNCDSMVLTVSPDIVKKITRATLRRFGSMYWHCIAGQTVYPVQIAVKFKIPLIIWGAHQGIDQVGMFSHFDEVEMTRKYRKEHDLMGFESEDLVDDFDGVTESDVIPFSYPHNLELEQVGVRGIYLNNYIRWDSRIQHEQMIREHNYETALQNRTFDTYNDVDCWNYSDVHDYIKWVKHGYGKVVDHACREIRLGRMTRECAIKLVQQYQAREPLYLQLFLNWLGITKNSFHHIIDQHRNLTIWERDKNWSWRLRKDLYQMLVNDLSLKQAFYLDLPMKDFWLTGKRSSCDPIDQYILIGKGLPS